MWFSVGNVYASSLIISPFEAQNLHTKLIGRNLYQVELCTGGIEKLICSYILTGQNPCLWSLDQPTRPKPALCPKRIRPRLEDVQYVAVTHIHLDHGGGAGTLLKPLPNAKVIVHPRGAPHLVDPERLWPSSQSVLGYVSEIFGKPEPVPKDRIVPMTEGTIELGRGGKLTVYETSGTPHTT